jgi:sensor histidine kinase YesM
MFTFYVPLGVLPDWNADHLASAIKRNGSFFIWAKKRVINSIFSMSSFVIVAYFINYYLLPMFLLKRKRLTGVLLLLFSFIFLWFAQGFTGYIIQLNNYHFNPVRRLKPELVTYLSTPGIIRWIVLAGPILIGFFIAIKMGKRILLKQKETEQIAREKTTAELSLLKSQIHPHFLFNTLNNIYYLALSVSSQTPVMIRKLSGMLRYIINDCSQPFVPLDGEIKMIQDYIALEKIRYGDQIKMNIQIEGDAGNKQIAPLLMIPLVENSFKHGASKMIHSQWVNLEIKMNDEELYFSMMNNKPGQAENGMTNGHVGLRNVKKRLQLLYPGKHELTIVSEKETFSVSMKVRLLNEKVPGLKKEIKSSAIYVME